MTTQRVATAKARWTLTAFAGLRNYPAGHGTLMPTVGRKGSATCSATPNAKATPAYREVMWKTATGSVAG